MNFLNQFNIFTSAVILLLTVMYAYQLVYIAISLVRKKVKPLEDAKENHRYAIMISARNEQGVIHELLDSLSKQNYPKDRYDVFVIADNCTDQTADVARKNGAIVYERFNQEEVGKGYALNTLYHHVVSERGTDYYDAYVVFDADNIIDPNFLCEMNKKFDTGKYDALTTYRNSKNFATNWLSAAYSIWFLHEARHLNYVRDMIGAQCMISGTGFIVSRKLMAENNGWPYYFLTEDIQFSVNSTIQGKRIGYCDSAILYDEQPSTTEQSWKQRLRWAKGFFQIDGKYLGSLTYGMLTKSGKRLAFFDVLVTCLPASLLTIAMLILAVWILFAGIFMPYYVRLVFQSEMIKFIVLLLANFWVGMLALGALTVVMEWNRIPASKWDKVRFLPLFPLFMLYYLPITVQAMFAKVSWTPIQHHSTTELALNEKK